MCGWIERMALLEGSCDKDNIIEMNVKYQCALVTVMQIA